ncbi:phosphatidylglycerophosphatase A [candidate division TA06 bacterium]|nr:phosphatidylglycerophosphatase A [candidate division TA06 bacterium]
MKNTKSNYFVKALASAGFTGHCPIAPGTAGSLVGLVIWWFGADLNIWLQLSFIITLFFLGVWAATLAEKDWGHDAGRIVIDEVLGMWVTLWLVPKGFALYAIGFMLFRAFDIIKPLGARQSQKLPGGWGVMVDDLLAGIYANVVLQVVFRVFHLGHLIK